MICHKEWEGGLKLNGKVTEAIQVWLKALKDCKTAKKLKKPKNMLIERQSIYVGGSEKSIEMSKN